MEVPPPETMRNFMEYAPISMMICDADTVHYANRSFARLLGYVSADELADLHPIDDVVSEEHREACRGSLLRTLSGEGELEQQWFHARRRDGTDIYLHARYHPMRAPDSPLALLTIVDDTDEREERSRLAMLSLAVDTVSEAIFVTDMAGQVLYANQAAGRLFGATPKELAGTSALHLISPDAQADHVTYFRTAERRVRSGEMLLRTPSGRDFPAAITLSLFPGVDGTETFAMAIVRELTAQKRMEAERALREKQLAVMLREAHHRIKNSLQIACDVLDLQCHAADVPEVAAALDKAAMRIRALSAVHEWITPDHDVSIVSVRQLIETIVYNLRDTLTPPGQPIDFDVRVDDHSVGSREATALALITTELVTNALRHAAPSRIGVQFVVGDDSATLEVTDDGALPPQALLDGGGRGFGLGLVKLLSEEQLGGTFTLDRRNGVTAARVVCPPCATPTPAGCSEVGPALLQTLSEHERAGADESDPEA